MKPLLSVGPYTPGQAIAGLLDVCFPDAITVLDLTYGKGGFWKNKPERIKVTGMDRNPARTKDVVADFTNPPFRADSFDVCVFDPPFHTDMGYGKASIMGSQFSTYATIPDLEAAVSTGCFWATEISRLGVIIKCQDYIHAQQAVWMSHWLNELMPGEPYDQLIAYRANKVIDPKWTRQLSVWRNHSTYWVWRWDSPKHTWRG